MILIISFISSFEINKVNSLPALTDPFPLIILSILITLFEAKLLTNLSFGVFIDVYLPKLPNQEAKDPPD